MQSNIKLFDFVEITDQKHKSFGKKGQLTDYDTVDKEFVLHFDKLTESGNVYWIGESTRVKREQVKRISKFQLERMETTTLNNPSPLEGQKKIDLLKDHGFEHGGELEPYSFVRICTFERFFHIRNLLPIEAVMRTNYDNLKRIIADINSDNLEEFEKFKADIMREDY